MSVFFLSFFFPPSLDAVGPTFKSMVRSPAPPVPAAARGSARAVAVVRCVSHRAGGLPPAAGPREQRPAQPEMVPAWKMETSEPSSSSSAPMARAAARRRSGRAHVASTVQKSSGAVLRCVRQEGEKARRRSRRSRPPRSPPSGLEPAASPCTDGTWPRGPVRTPNSCRYRGSGRYTVQNVQIYEHSDNY